MYRSINHNALIIIIDFCGLNIKTLKPDLKLTCHSDSISHE